jgi:nucleoside 2-deoxyribosyltransferase
MFVYIAAPYPERDAAIQVMERIEAAGFRVTSTWLREHDELADKYARLDLEDIRRSQIVVALNPPAYHNAGTGGRHVEFGFALGLKRPVVLVGERSNIFHYLDDIEVCDEADLVAVLRQKCREVLAQ